MPKTKPKKPASKFEAVVELKYGKGKKAQAVQLPVVVALERVWVRFGQRLDEALSDEAIDEALNVDIKTTVLNLKEFKAAYKVWQDAEDASTDED